MSVEVGILLTFRLPATLPFGCPANETAALVFLPVSLLRVVVGTIAVPANRDCKKRNKLQAESRKERTLPPRYFEEHALKDLGTRSEAVFLNESVWIVRCGMVRSYYGKFLRSGK